MDLYGFMDLYPPKDMPLFILTRLHIEIVWDYNTNGMLSYR